MSPKDLERVRLARQGDRRAFEELVVGHQGRIVNLCNRMLGGRSVAEEVSQEVFVAAWRNLSSFRGESQFGTWLYRIALNRCKNRIAYEARRRREAHEPIDKEINTGEGSFRRELADPKSPEGEAEMMRSQRQRMVHDALDGLSEDHRQILVLRDLEGLSYEEVGELLQLATGTVKSRLNRARLALRDALAPRMAELNEEMP